VKLRDVPRIIYILQICWDVINMLEVYEGKTFVTVCLRTAFRRPTRTVHDYYESLWVMATAAEESHKCKCWRYSIIIYTDNSWASVAGNM